MRLRLAVLVTFALLATGAIGSVYATSPEPEGIWVGGAGDMTLEESLIAQAAADPEFAEQAIAFLTDEQRRPADLDIDVDATVAHLRELSRDPEARERVMRDMAEQHGVVYRPASAGPTGDDSTP